ncbi:MAG: hypothetical protein ABI423_09090 [Burkholderiales bacterium]
MRAHLPEIHAELSRIRCAWVPELIEYLALKLEASRGRAEAGAQRAAARSAATRARIVAALGVSPLDYDLDLLITVVKKRLGEDTLDARTIKAHLLEFRRERCITEPKCSRRCATVQASTKRGAQCRIR